MTIKENKNDSEYILIRLNKNCDENYSNILYKFLKYNELVSNIWQFGSIDGLYEYIKNDSLGLIPMD